MLLPTPYESRTHSLVLLLPRKLEPQNKVFGPPNEEIIINVDSLEKYQRNFQRSVFSTMTDSSYNFANITRNSHPKSANFSRLRAKISFPRHSSKPPPASRTPTQATSTRHREPLKANSEARTPRRRPPGAAESRHAKIRFWACICAWCVF